jgi:hypothetical protein
MTLENRLGQAEQQVTTAVDHAEEGEYAESVAAIKDAVKTYSTFLNGNDTSEEGVRAYDGDVQENYLEALALGTEYALRAELPDMAQEFAMAFNGHEEAYRDHGARSLSPEQQKRHRRMRALSSVSYERLGNDLAQDYIDEAMQTSNPDEYRDLLRTFMELRGPGSTIVPPLQPWDNVTDEYEEVSVHPGSLGDRDKLPTDLYANDEALRN